MTVNMCAHSKKDMSKTFLQHQTSYTEIQTPKY